MAKIKEAIENIFKVIILYYIMRQCIKCKLYTEIVYKDMCYVCFIKKAST